MNTNWMILAPVLVPVIGALALRFRKLNQNKAILRGVTGGAVLLTALLVGIVVAQADSELLVLGFLPEMPIYFRTDALAKFFAILTVGMWLFSTMFSFEYMNHQKEEERYSCFSLLSLGALLGICFSGNLMTTYLFYEMMTLATFPLVLHERTKEAISAAFTYLYYSIGGAFLGLVGIFFLYQSSADTVASGGRLAYVNGGFLDPALATENRTALLVAIFLMLVGLGSKVGMFPLHGWLTKAHPVAPAPASALLSGNITKMGILFIIRVVFHSVGVEFLRDSWVQYALLTLAIVTVFLGSMLAYKERLLKKRLAYSTVSQTSYALAGLYLLHPVAICGAMLHILFHSVIKNLLFLSAGSMIYATGKQRVEEFRGIGKRMPITMWCFTIAGLALVGIPPCSAFVSKWKLATGALESGITGYQFVVPVVLLISALLTAGYLLTVTADAFFIARREEEVEAPNPNPTAKDPGLLMIVPLVVLAALAVLFGILPVEEWGIFMKMLECLQ